MHYVFLIRDRVLTLLGALEVGFKVGEGWFEGLGESGKGLNTREGWCRQARRGLGCEGHAVNNG